MRLFYIAGLVAMIFSSCEKKICGCAPPFQVYYLQAKVINIADISCHLPVLDFTEDSTRIRLISGRDDLQFTVKQLPQEFNVLNKKLYVEATRPQPSEDFPCTAIGFSYPHLKITDAKNRD